MKRAAPELSFLTIEWPLWYNLKSLLAPNFISFWSGKVISSLKTDVEDTSILPFISNYADENLYDKQTPENEVYKNFPKVNLYKVPDIKKLRFFASNMLTWQKYTKGLYQRQVERVTEIRQLLREELDL